MTGLVKTADQGTVRKVNSFLVLSALRAERRCSRARIAKELGLTRSTVSRLVLDLIDAGFVRETTLEKPSSGRPGMLLELNPAGGTLIGLEIDIDLMDAVLTDFVGNVLWSRRVEHTPGESRDDILARAEALVAEALAVADSAHSPALGIGVAVAALVDSASGVVLVAPHLSWRDVPIAAPWRKRFGLPVVVENEANAAAVGEYYFGRAEGVGNFVFVSVGVGLAAGVFVNGRLLRGGNGYAGQVGHTVRVPGGEPCMCGRRGCWVTQVGLPAISRRLHQAAGDGSTALKLPSEEAVGAPSHATIQALADAATAGDPTVIETLRETGRFLGLGIADLVNIFDPKIVVLGGALSPLLEVMLPTVQETVSENLLAGPRQEVTVVISANGASGSAIGAMAGVFDIVTRDTEFLRV